MLGLVLGLRLRQTEGFLSSVLALMGLDLPAPDHTTTLSRRARTWSPPARCSYRQSLPDGPLHVLVDSTGLEVYGAGQWLGDKHGAKSRRRWRKLHLALDADSGEIIAHVMTEQDAGDAWQVEALHDQMDDPVGQFTADGPYDGDPTYDAVLEHTADAGVVVPPRANAVERPDTDLSCQRDRHIAAINADGRMKWQAATDYGKRSLVETAIGRSKSIMGHRPRARSFAAQKTEVAIGCAVLHRMLTCASPKSVRRMTETA